MSKWRLYALCIAGGLFIGCLYGVLILALTTLT